MKLKNVPYKVDIQRRRNLLITIIWLSIKWRRIKMSARLNYLRYQMAIREYILEGRAEMAEEIALNMFRDNKPMEEITKYTGISAERIQELSQEL